MAQLFWLRLNSVSHTPPISSSSTSRDHPATFRFQMSSKATKSKAYLKLDFHIHNVATFLESEKIPMFSGLAKTKIQTSSHILFPQFKWLFKRHKGSNCNRPVGYQYQGAANTPQRSSGESPEVLLVVDQSR